MDLSQLIAEYRRRADDRAEPPFVEDADLAPMASEAEREACLRARLLFDDDSAAICQYAVAAGSAVVKLHSAVDVITAAEFLPSGSNNRRQLGLKGMDWVREQCDWSTRTSSRPGYLVHLAGGKARLWPTPSVAGVLYLAVYRLPLNDIEDDGDEPEIEAVHHMGLVDWLLYRVFSTPDSELENPKRAANALQEFELRFGPRPSADVRRRQRERRRVTTRCL